MSRPRLDCLGLSFDTGPHNRGSDAIHSDRSPWGIGYKSGLTAPRHSKVYEKTDWCPARCHVKNNAPLAESVRSLLRSALSLSRDYFLLVIANELLGCNGNPVLSITEYVYMCLYVCGYGFQHRSLRGGGKSVCGSSSERHIFLSVATKSPI